MVTVEKCHRSKETLQEGWVKVAAKIFPGKFMISSYSNRKSVFSTRFHIYSAFFVHDLSIFSFSYCISFWSIKQVGTVVESPLDFFSGRLAKRERKGSLADELLSNTTLGVYRWDENHIFSYSCCIPSTFIARVKYLLL